MSGHDIGNEIRINWDDNVSPRFPYFTCSANYHTDAILAAVTSVIESRRCTLVDIAEWLAAYLALPEDQRRDWIPEPAKKQKRAYHRKVK